MEKNVGSTIKLVALILLVLDLLATVIGFIALLAIDQTPLAFIVFASGNGVAWVGYLLLYGYGEIVEKTNAIYMSITQNSMYMRHFNIKASNINNEYATCTAEHTEVASAIANNEYAMRSAEQHIREKQEKQAQERQECTFAWEQAKKGVATSIKKNRFGEAICPSCKKTLQMDDFLGITKCPDCNLPIKIIK